MWRQVWLSQQQGVGRALDGKGAWKKLMKPSRKWQENFFSSKASWSRPILAAAALGGVAWQQEQQHLCAAGLAVKREACCGGDSFTSLV